MPLVDFAGAVLIVASAASLSAQYIWLRRRGRLSQAIFGPGAFAVRGALLGALAGVLFLTGSWAVVGVMAVVVVWECTVQVAALVRRARDPQRPEGDAAA